MTKKNYIILAISLAVGVLIKLVLPASNGLTESGVALLSVFVPTIILWIGIGTGWTSFLALVALALVGVCDGQSVFNSAWGNSVNTVIIPMLIIVQVMIDSGAMMHIAKWILSRKIVRGHPYVFMLLLCVAISVLGTVVYPVVMCFIFLKLIDSITESIGCSKQDKFYKALLLITLWVTTVMDAVWPFARPIPTVVMTFLANLGYEISIIQWMKFSIPFGLICIGVTLLIIRFLYRPDVSKFKNYDDAAIRQQLKESPINRSGKAASVSVILVIISWVLPFITSLGSISTYLGAIGTPTFACLAVAVLCIIKNENGKPVIELSSALAKVNWSLVVFLGAVMFFASYIGRAEFGIVAWFTNMLSGAVEVVSPVVIVIIALLLPMLATNFMSNTVSATISISVFLPILVSLSNGDNSLIIVCAIAIGCVANNAYLTYASSPTSGVILTKDTISIGEAFKYSSALIAGVFVSVVAFVPVAAKFF